jgi:hypothetical protein
MILMAKVKFDVNKASSDLKNKINNLLKNDEMSTEIGIFLTERVRFEARSGKPLNDDRSFPNLQQSTIDNRKRLSKNNKTQQAFRPDFSNLTLTGQLQNAISFKKLKAGVYELFVKDNVRSPYKGGSGKAITNAKVDEHLRKKKFILFTSKGLKSEKKIPRRIKQILLRFLRKSLRA